jgi:hypothetical protein
MYDPDDISTLDLPLRVLRDVVVLGKPNDRPWDSSNSGTPTMKANLEQRYHKARLEKLIAERPEIGECPGPKGIHEWEPPESLWNGAANVELRACQHCSTHLFTDLRGYDRTDIFFSSEPDPGWNLLSLEADPSQCQHTCHDDPEWNRPCPDCNVANPEK